MLASSCNGNFSGRLTTQYILNCSFHKHSCHTCKGSLHIQNLLNHIITKQYVSSVEPFSIFLFCIPSYIILNILQSADSQSNLSKEEMVQPNTFLPFWTTEESYNFPMRNKKTNIIIILKII